MERPNEIRIAQAEIILGVRRPELKRLIKAGTICAVGSGPARRILIDSIEKSGLAIQSSIPFPEPEKQWYILTMSGDCRMRNGANHCGHPDTMRTAIAIGTTLYCTLQNCPLAVKTPCKSKA